MDAKLARPWFALTATTVVVEIVRAGRPVTEPERAILNHRFGHHAARQHREHRGAA